MNKSKAVNNAKGNSVTHSSVDNALLSTLKNEEQPHFIFPLPAGLSVDGSNNGFLGDVKYSWRVVVTNIRMLLIKKSKDDTKIDQIPLSNVRAFHGKPGGLLSIGNITIETVNHTYTGKLHKKIKREEISAASKFIENWDSNKVDIDVETIDLADSASATAHTKLSQVKVIESYGVNLPEGYHSLEIDTEGLHFTMGKFIGSNDSYSIESDKIEFDDMATSSQRDFSKENRSRYMNQLNPFLDDSSPTKKRNREILKIPLDGGNRYVSLEPGNFTSFSELLDGMSRIDPRLSSDDTNSPEENRQTDEEPTANQSALEILKQRLAKGEISTEEFEERKQYLDE